MLINVEEENQIKAKSKNTFSGSSLIKLLFIGNNQSSFLKKILWKTVKAWSKLVKAAIRRKAKKISEIDDA